MERCSFKTHTHVSGLNISLSINITVSLRSWNKMIQSVYTVSIDLYIDDFNNLKSGQRQDKRFTSSLLLLKASVLSKWSFIYPQSLISYQFSSSSHTNTFALHVCFSLSWFSFSSVTRSDFNISYNLFFPKNISYIITIFTIFHLCIMWL